MKSKTVTVGKFKIVIQESDEASPLGVIIDVYDPKEKEGDPLESFTLWYDDYLEE